MLEQVLPHAPILAILLPMIAAPLAVLLRARLIAFLISVVAAIGSFCLSFYLLQITQDGTILSYHIGGWAPPLGIEYRVDAANALVMVIVSLMAVLVMPYARKSIELEVDRRHHTLFYAMMMLCFTGLMGVTVTGDAFNVFVFLEISSLSTYVLVALGAKRDKRALSAAYDYLVLGTVGATFFVIGLGFLYMATGTLNMVDMAERLVALEENRTVRSAFAFIIIGMGLKLAMFPLHRWLPGAYAYAPSAVSVFLAATATKVAIYVVVRFLFSVFSAREGFEQDMVQFIMLPLAILAMFGGSLVAIYQSNVKRLLAFSSVAQIGYMVLGMSLLTATGLSATMNHLFAHALTKGALFMAIGAVVYRLGSPLMRDLAGLGKTMPWTAAALTVGGLSLIGVPGTVGFVSKWVLLTAALEKGWWPVGALIVLSSLVTIVYVWRTLETMYLAPPKPGAVQKEAPLMLLLPLWVATLGVIYFGFDASQITVPARAAAEAVFQGGFTGDTVNIIGQGGR